MRFLQILTWRKLRWNPTLHEFSKVKHGSRRIRSDYKCYAYPLCLNAKYLLFPQTFQIFVLFSYRTFSQQPKQAQNNQIKKQVEHFRIEATNSNEEPENGTDCWKRKVQRRKKLKERKTTRNQATRNGSRHWRFEIRATFHACTSTSRSERVERDAEYRKCGRKTHRLVRSAERRRLALWPPVFALSSCVCLSLISRCLWVRFCYSL